MNIYGYIASIAGVIFFTFLYFTLDKAFLKKAKISKTPVTYESAKETLNRLGNWTTWLTGLQTAAIAAMGFLYNRDGLSIKAATLLKTWGFFVLLFFGASIIISTWLLASLPSLQQRLKNTLSPEPENDVYMMNIFEFVPFRFGRFTGLVHTYFLMGIVFFALFIFTLFRS